MAFDRRIRITVRSQATRVGGIWSWSDLQIEDLHVSFRVNRSSVFNDNTAELTVYGASATTRARLHAPGSNILIEAGYADSGIGLIYQGAIIRARSSHEGPDWITVCQCATIRSQDQPFQTTPVAISRDSNSTLDMVLRDIGTAIGLIVAGESAARAISLPNGFVYAGSVRGAIEQARAFLRIAGLEIFADMTELVVYSKTNFTDRDSIYLDYKSGLISAEDTTDLTDLSRDIIQTIVDSASDAYAVGAIADATQTLPRNVSIRALLNAKARPNSLVQIGEGDATGVYLIDTIEFSGDNFGGDFIMTIGASSE